MSGKYKFLAMYKLSLFVLILMLSASCVEAATIAGGKYFHGQNFTSSIGGHFRVFGSDPYKEYNNDTGLMELHYKRATVMSDIDDTIAILNGTCASTARYNYCYIGSSINYDDEKTFQDSQVLSVMEIIISSLPSPTTLVTFTRNTTLYAYCGELVTVPIIVTNTGSVYTDITYTEVLPFNTVITTSSSGNVNENMITFKDTIMPNSSKTYFYTMMNLDCQSKLWIAKYTFTTFNGTVISNNFTNLNITTQNAYSANESISTNRTNSLLSEITYTWNITNTHPTVDLVTNMSIHVPGLGLVVTDKSLGMSFKNGMYSYAGVVPVGKTQSVYIKFYALNYSSYNISNNINIFVNEHVLEYFSSNILQVLKPQVRVYMDVNTTINKSLTVSIWVRNDDLSSKYYYIYGILKGIADEEPLSYNVMEPDSTILLTQKIYNTTNLGAENITLVFDGVYRDKNNKEYKLYLEQAVTLNVPNPTKINISNSTNIISTPVDNTPINIITTTTNITGQNITGQGNTGSNSKNIKTTDNSSNNNNSSNTSGKKDLITRFIETLSEFLQSIFG